MLLNGGKARQIVGILQFPSYKRNNLTEKQIFRFLPNLQETLIEL